MNVRIVSMMVAGALALSAGAYQSTTKANIDLRAAYTKTIDWLGIHILVVVDPCDQ